MNTVHYIVKTMRPPFLLLVASSLSLSVAYAHNQDIDWSGVILMLVCICALASHICVNMLNEAADFSSDLDRHTQRTPFSGGSGALITAPQAFKPVKIVSLLFLAITVFSGLWIMYLRTDQLIVLFSLGLLGCLLVTLYTPWLNRNPWLCLIAPGLGFGIIMVVGGFIAITGQYDANIVLLALISALLTNNLLLFNQYPDKKADEQHGRRHWLIVYGKKSAARVLLVHFIAIAIVILALIERDVLPNWGGVLLLFLLPASHLYREALAFTSVTPSFLRAMGLNVALTLLMPVMVSAVLCVAV